MKAAFYDQTDAKEPLLRQLFGSKNTGVGHETSRNLSDKSKFKISSSAHCVFVSARKCERMVSACMVPNLKHGGGGVLVWGTITYFPTRQ